VKTSKEGFTLGQLAQALGATLEGDPRRVVTGVAPLESAGPDEVSFLTHARYHDAAKTSRAGAFLAGADAAGLPAPVLRVRTPQQALVDLLNLFHPPAALVPGVHATAVIGANARIDRTASVGPHAVVEAGAGIGARVRVGPLVYIGAGVEVGEDCALGVHVTLLDGVRLGRRVVVHPGAVLGADGFGFAFDGAQHRKIPQTGGVLIEDDVEIGANTTIDRATFGDTIVRRGTKIDNLVQIGHNVRIGAHTAIAGCVGIAGSATIGAHCMLGGGVGISGHVSITDRVVITGATQVTRSIAKAGVYSGLFPFDDNASWEKNAATLRNLHALRERVRALEKKLS
jgi:UDP-3-O-[3-hydroxymyristoyl] glucosamine N-acyltransferase